MRNIVIKFIQYTKLYNYFGQYRAMFKDCGFKETDVDIYNLKLHIK